jgi:hypothetical protein
MKKFALMFLAVAAVFAVGCETAVVDRNPLGEGVDSKYGRDIDGPGEITYSITLQGAEYDENSDATTFTYLVISNPDGGPAISHWDIEILEGCGGSDVLLGSNDNLVEFSDPDPTTGVRGVKFDTGYDDQEERTVTVTLAGEWSVGEATIAVKSGNGFVLGTVEGPVCNGGGGDDEEEVTYTISGIVFEDLNQNGVQDDNEVGIEGVTVILADGDTTVTDANGSYLFDELDAGDYTVDFETPTDYLPTTPTRIDVTIVDEDVVVNAGFVPVYDVAGVVFFDINGDGVQGIDEPGIEGVTVSLTPGGSVGTDASGAYLFEDNVPGDYNVSFETPDGLTPTTATSVDFVIVDEDIVVNAGFALNFEEICGAIADGRTIGFWKNNIGKALSGKNKGVQVSAAALNSYTDLISDFALEPFEGLTMADAENILTARGSDESVLLAKQLLGSEYNYAAGAYINGNELVTRLFVYQGEYVLKNASEYSRSEILEMKDWFDAYNNSHGGAIEGPDCE